MKADLIRIGNSQGLRIPRAILEQCGFRGRVEMRVEGECLIISPIAATRQGWDHAFRTMGAHGDDALILDDDLEHSFDAADWQW